jgi:CBS domain containing-hemolysin-like protein
MALMAILMVVLMIGLNALYVAAEFGAVTVRRTQIQQRADEGSLLARKLLPHLADASTVDRYVAACQIGITFSSLALGAYGQAAIAPAIAPVFERFGSMQSAAAHSTATVGVLIVLTVLQMILGELVPKSVALQSPVRAAMWTVTPMRLSLKLFSWFIWLLNGSGLLVLRLFGIRNSEHKGEHSAEEIEALIEESSEGGVLPAAADQPLKEALHLSSRPVSELMVPRDQIEAVDIACGSEELAKKAAESAYTRIPVYEKSLDNVLGIAHAKDLAIHSMGRGMPADVRTCLRPMMHVAPDTAATALLSQMREQHSQTAIVRDEAGRTLGLVTVDDILETLLGGVADEFKDSAEKMAGAP